jgi:hypothetical protein
MAKGQPQGAVLVDNRGGSARVPAGNRTARRKFSSALSEAAAAGWRLVVWACNRHLLRQRPIRGSSVFVLPDHTTAYLDSDAASRSRDPSGVKVPLGPFGHIGADAS